MVTLNFGRFTSAALGKGRWVSARICLDAAAGEKYLHLSRIFCFRPRDLAIMLKKMSNFFSIPVDTVHMCS
jgi:hypothetical protein